MKRYIALLLSLVLILSGCTKGVTALQNTEQHNQANELTTANEYVAEKETDELTFDSLEDKRLLKYIEDVVYQDTIDSLDSDEYFVEDVSAIYVSKEYLDELEYNSQENIYFGYTLSELNDIFQGEKYIFTLNDEGTTTVEALKEIDDTSTQTIIKNVAIGTGVILVCVTVSIVSAGAGAPAVSMIFLSSAASASSMAVSAAGFGGISSGIVRGVQTGDFNEAIKASAMGASEGFKWGAISGAIIGGSGEAFVLNAATKSGLTMDEAAMIQLDSNLPIDVISQIHSVDEYLVYKEAGLKPMMVDGRIALVPNIDLNYVSTLPDGTEVTNLVRMQKGYAPLDPLYDEAYELHHIGQKADATLAVLTKKIHNDNAAILNIFGKESEIDRDAFGVTRKEFWKYMGNHVFANGGA